MQDSQLRWMIGLSLLVLALVAALSFGESESVGHDPDATVQLLDLPDIAKVVRIERTIRDETLILVGDGEGGWSMESPATGDADASATFRLLDDLREMQRGVPIEAEPSELDDFGLGDPPLVRVGLTLDDGTQQSAVFGDAAPVGWRTYARTGEGQVIAVSGRSELLTEPSSLFLDHRILRFDPSSVRRVRLSTDQGVIDVAGQGTRWWIEGFTRADPDRVDDLVMGLLDLRFDRVMELGAVSEPRATVEVFLADGEMLELRVGERTPMGDLVEGPLATGMVFPESLALLGMGPADLGDRRAFPLDPTRDDRVVIERGGTVWEATRNQSVWTSDDRPVDATGHRVEGLSAAGIAYTLEPVALPSVVWATVRIHRGEDVRAIEVGPEVDGFHGARDVEGGQPYRIRASELDALVE